MNGSKTLVLCIFLVLMPSVALTATFEVTINENGFSPPTLVVNKGDTVRWVNRGDLPHSVTSGDSDFMGFVFSNGFFESGTLNPGDTFDHTFALPGVFLYFDGPDRSQSSKKGTIIAEGVSISPGDSGLLVTQNFDIVIYVTANYPALTISVIFDGAVIFDGPYASFRNVTNVLGIRTITTETGAAATIIPVLPATFSRGTHTLTVTISAPSGFLATDDATYTVTRERGFAPSGTAF